MLAANTVTVRRYDTTYDADHDRVTTPTEEIVENVLIAPGKTDDITTDTHFEGVRVAFTLGFPKTYAFKSLKGAEIDLPYPWNVTGKVIGDPIPNDIRNCPTEWYWTVYLEYTNG